MGSNAPVDFPRGGVRKNREGPKCHEKRKEISWLQDSTQPAGPPPKRRKGKHGKDAPGSESKLLEKTTNGIEDHLAINKIQLLKKDMLSESLNILGVIHEVQTHRLCINLPGMMEGFVVATDISDAYTNLARECIADPSGRLRLPALTEMFRPGTFIPCQVKQQVEAQNNQEKSLIQLTINPKAINKGFHKTDLMNGLVLQAAVVSQEDHGYVMDLGISNVKGFLTSKNAQSFISDKNNDRPLYVGQVIACLVSLSQDSLDTQIVNLIADPKKIAKTIMNEELGLNLNTILPGMQVPITISKACFTGLFVNIWKFSGFVHKWHLQSPWDFPQDYSLESQCVASVLYIHPLLKSIYVSLQPHLRFAFSKELFPSLSRLQIIKDATIKEITHDGAFLKVKGNHKALCPKDHLPFNLKFVDAAKKPLVIGSKHQVKILKIDEIDNLVIVTMRRSILNEEILDVKNIKAGDVVKASIIRFTPSGMSVKVGSNLFGFVPNLHSSDYPVAKLENKFKLKKVITCRVLRVNPEQNKTHLLLTHKPSLVKSSLQPIVSYDSLVAGDVANGVVVSISPARLIVGFYNDVKGIVNAKEMVNCGIDKPEETFYCGQIVACRVVAVVPEKNKIFLSLQMRGKKLKSTKTKTAVKSAKKQKIIDLMGKLSDGIIMKKLKNGVLVKLLPSSMKAYLPTCHLSDHEDHCPLLFDVCQPTDSIKNMVGFQTKNTAFKNKKKNLPVVSKKQSLVHYAQTHSDFSPLDFQVGETIPSVVERQLASGTLYVGFPDGSIRKLNSKVLPLRKENSGVLLPGRSLLTKVMAGSTGTELVLSAELSECWDNHTTASLDLLQSYLQEEKAIMDALQKSAAETKAVAEQCVGKSVNFTIAQRTKVGLIGTLENGANGIVTRNHVKGLRFQIGDTIKGIVLHQDLKKNVAELSLSKSFVDAVKRRENSTKAPIQLNQELNAEVLCIKPNYVLVILRGHAFGALAYLPTHRHLNDIIGRSLLYTVGETYKVVIKRHLENHVLAVLKEHEVHPYPSIPGTPDYKEKVQEEVPIAGKNSAAVITSIGVQQLNLILRTEPVVSGRVFITEIQDVVADGSLPLTQFEEGQNIVVRILELKATNSSKSLYIPNPVSEYVAECSLKPRVLLAPKSCPSGRTKPNLKRGSCVVGFVKQFINEWLIFNVAPSLTGRVDSLNLSNDPKIVKDPIPHFNPGEAFHVYVTSNVHNVLELSLTGLLKIKRGSIVNAEILSGSRSEGAYLRLPFGYTAMASLTDLSDKFQDSETLLQGLIDQKIARCYVLDVDSKTKVADVSFRSSRVLSSSYPVVIDPEIEQLSEGMILNGFIKSINRKKLSASVLVGRNLDGDVVLSETEALSLSTGNVVTISVIKISDQGNVFELEECSPDNRNHNEDTEDELPALPEMVKDVASQLISEKENRKASSKNRKRRRSEEMLNSTENMVSTPVTHVDSAEQNQRDTIQNSTKSRKRRKLDKLDPAESSPVLSPEVATESTSRGKRVDKNQRSLKKRKREILPISTKTNEGTVEVDAIPDFQKVIPSAKKPQFLSLQDPIFLTEEEIKNAPRLELDAHFLVEDPAKIEAMAAKLSEEDTDSDDEATGSKKSKAKKKQLETRTISEEKYLYKTERLLADEDREPCTVDDFDRLVLSSPNSSIVWLKYMAFHLKDAEVDKARTIAERALKTICFRDEHEKLNIWVAFLNLENLYGTEELLDAVFKRALQNNEPRKIYEHLAKIYVNTNKIDQAEQIFLTMLKRFKSDKEVWLSNLEFLMSNGKAESARKVLERSFNSLQQREHVDVIGKFAQLEFKHGDPERGRTMFENVLSNYPRRTDLWSVYIDLMVKRGDIDAARNILDQVLAGRLSPKQVETFFKKYLALEEQHGTDASRERVRQRRLAYAGKRTTTRH